VPPAYADSDIDFFVLETDAHAAWLRVLQVLEAIAQAGLWCTRVRGTQFTISLVLRTAKNKGTLHLCSSALRFLFTGELHDPAPFLSGKWPKIQIIMMQCRSIVDLLSNFDVDVCKVAYDGRYECIVVQLWLLFSSLQTSDCAQKCFPCLDEPRHDDCQQR
jgi:hypothetical protein